MEQHHQAVAIHIGKNVHERMVQTITRQQHAIDSPATAIAVSPPCLRRRSTDMFDSRWRVDISDFVSETRDTPRLRRDVDAANDVGVEMLATRESLVQGDLAKLAAHRCLSQLNHG